jgi:AraC family transcriptional regulator
MMNPVEVKSLPTFHVAYIRHISGYAKGQFNREINAAFQRVCGWVAARGLFQPGTLVIGIPYDNPEITPNDRCRYDACVSVPAGTSPNGEMGIQDIPGGRYAVCHIEVSAAETQKIGQTVDQLYGEWLPDSGYQADDKPPLEIYYDNPGKPAGSWISMDYCLPVRPM